MLTFDAANHIYTMAGHPVPSVTQILADMGLIDTTWFDEWSRTRGRMVHRVVELHLSGELDEENLDPILMPYLDAWKQFEVDTKFAPTATEAPLYSIVHQFAGTPDYIGVLNGCEAVVDAKSGAIYRATALQLAGYEVLAGRPLKRFALQLMDTGKYKLTSFTSRQDRGIFLAALAVWQWKNNGRK
jgi:hypothetical protein